MRILILTAAWLLIAACFIDAQDFTGGFNFYLPPDDGDDQIFLPSFPAENIAHFIGISADGHFEQNGSPIRFWGVNLSTNACFPLKTKVHLWQRECARWVSI